MCRAEGKNPMSSQNCTYVRKGWPLMENNYLVSLLWELCLNMINTFINVPRTNQTSKMEPFTKTVNKSFKLITIFNKPLQLSYLIGSGTF